MDITTDNQASYDEGYAAGEAAGVASVDIARMPAMHMYMVRGMGVADRESTSTDVATDLTLSFWRTPKRCSSSTTSSPSRVSRAAQLGQTYSWSPPRHADTAW